MKITKILVTGAAGFIGFHLVNALVKKGFEVIGLDSINDYYDIRLKYGRLCECGISQEKILPGQLIQSDIYQNYRFIQLKLEDRDSLNLLFKEEKFDKVCNLAAQAGVRYSLTNPEAYIDSNITGFMNILECCRYNDIRHLAYASSSSVYGINAKLPFSTRDSVDHPVSLYAASKKSNELMAHTYSHLFGIPTTGLRFFTVYGPWGRPDMALFLFTKAILEGKSIKVFNNGNMRRDFTYIDDIIDGITRVLLNPPERNESWNAENPNPGSSSAPYKVYNIGNSSPVRLMDFIEAIEKKLKREAVKELLPLQAGDVPATWADVSDLQKDLGYSPQTDIYQGISRFIDWYYDFYFKKESRYKI